MSEEDLSLGNWDFSPKDLKTFSEAKLFNVMVENRVVHLMHGLEGN